MSYQDQFRSDLGTWEKLSQVSVKGAEYDSRERQPHPKCLEGTRVDLLDYIYELLNKREKNQLIWLHGTAGVGKSAVAFTVAEKMRGLKMTEETKIEKRLGGTFFFSRKHTKRRTTGYFFATLAYQLATNFPSVREDVNRAIIENPALLDPDKSLRDQMEALFLRPLRKLSRRLRECPPLVFAIDALDECTPESLESESFDEPTSESELADLISLLGEALCEPDLPITHLLLTSRPEEHICKAMRTEDLRPLVCEIPVKTSGKGVAATISLDGADVDNDIYVFLQHSFRKLENRHEDFPQPSADQLARLASRAGRRFIVASTMMKFIDDRKHDPRDRLQLMLELTSEMLPGTEVYKLYDLILSTCTDPTLAYLHLSVVAALTDPLPISQISKLLGPGQGRDVETVLTQLRSIIDVPTDSSLPVSIYHSSVRDYVSHRSNCSLRQVKHNTSPHSLLALSSFRLMMRDLPDRTALLDALSELKKHSQATQPEDPQSLRNSLSFIVQPPEPLQVLIGLLWVRGYRGSELQFWIETLDGHAWLQTQGGNDWMLTDAGRQWLSTQGGKDWLQTPGGLDWLQTPAMKVWVRTQGGLNWLQTQAALDWLQTQYGRDWLQTPDVKDWVETQGGRQWLQTPGVREWLLTERGRSWLETLSVRDWLETPGGQVWLETSDVQDWLETWNGRFWLETMAGRNWLQAAGDYRDWLQTMGGKNWLQTPDGNNWLQIADGQAWLCTPGGQVWVQTQIGKVWLETPGGRHWLETSGGKVWLETPGGKNWLETAGGKAWMTNSGRQVRMQIQILDVQHRFLNRRISSQLETLGGQDWLQTPDGRDWLQTPDGRDWLRTLDGRDWVQTPSGRDWLQTQSGRHWLWTIGRHWLRTLGGRHWLRTPGGSDWLRTPGGSDWLQTLDGRDWLRTVEGEAWMKTEDGQKWLQDSRQQWTQNLAQGRSILVETRSWLQTVNGRNWLQTIDGRNWLRSIGREEWLQTIDGQEWLQTMGGKEWLQTQDGRVWLLTAGGRDWLQTLDGRAWMTTFNGRAWLQTSSGRHWLGTSSGYAWMRSSGGRGWLQTLDGQEWLQTQSGQRWFRTLPSTSQPSLLSSVSHAPISQPSSQPPRNRGDHLQTSDEGAWLKVPGSLRWLQTLDGRQWMQYRGGWDWMLTRCGRNWLEDTDGQDWLQTEGGRDWLQAQGGQDWLQTYGRDWLQTQGGQDWLQTPHGQAWRLTSIWVTVEEFSSTLEAIREYTIAPELPLLPAFQAIQQFKSLPDFLMFPAFLALRHQDRSTSALLQSYPPEMEIIHAMKAFSTFAYEARARSRSASDALNYACQNWAIHLSRAPNPWDEKLAYLFKSFWNHTLLSWLERQWSLKDLQSCLTILSEGQKLAMEHLQAPGSFQPRV